MKERTEKLIVRRVGIEQSTVIVVVGEHVLARGDFWAQGAKMLESCEVSSLLYTVRPMQQCVPRHAYRIRILVNMSFYLHGSQPLAHWE